MFPSSFATPVELEVSQLPLGRTGADDQTHRQLRRDLRRRRSTWRWCLPLHSLQLKPRPGLPSSEEHLELPLGITAYENWGAVRGSRAWLSGFTPPCSGRCAEQRLPTQEEVCFFRPTSKARPDRDPTTVCKTRRRHGLGGEEAMIRGARVMVAGRTGY